MISMIKVRANYRVCRETPEEVLIEDMNLGRMSVTNDADNVVAEVVSVYGNKRILYIDSDGRTNELVHENGVFKKFGTI